MMELTIHPYEIMVLLNEAWDKSFSRVNTNRKDILDHGWNPLNYNLLLHSDIRETMTERERSDGGQHLTNQHPMVIEATPDGDTTTVSTLTVTLDEMNM